MHIEAELDEIHGESLMELQRHLQRPLPEVLAALIDLGRRQWLDPVTAPEEPSPLYSALAEIGFIGCIEAEDSLARDYKTRLDFSHKCGDTP